METFKIAIIGTGWIAEKMAITIRGMQGVEGYAISSRDLSKAQAFADKYGFTRAYGSYEEMLDDEQ
ncbi:1 5-anhydro-D-fructose reductase, partial [termite gut metagenome]